MSFRDRSFRGLDEIEIAIGEFEEIVFEFRQLTRRAKRVGVDDGRRNDFFVAASSVLIEEEVDERAIEARAGTEDQGETRTRDFRRALEVEDAEGGPQVPVRLRGASED